MPDPKLRPIPDVPMGIDKKTWDFLNVVKHNLNILAGSKGTQDNKGVTFEDLNSEIASVPDAQINAYVNPSSSLKFRTIEPKQYIPCTSLTLTKGTPVGTVADMQVVLDGNLYQVTETAGVPGLDLSVFIAEVPDFGGLVISAYYIGATSGIGGDINGDWLAPVHYIAVQLYNNSTAAWDSIIYIPDSRALNYRHIELPRDRTINYINAANRVDVRFYHPITGNINHVLYIDYVAVVRNLK